MLVLNIYGMSLSKWFVALSTGWVIYAPSVNDSVSLLTLEPYAVTAILNDSTWFGSGAAYKPLLSVNNSSCNEEHVDIQISTDIPCYNIKVKKVVTGCVNACEPTQRLFFHNIPLVVGRYSFSTLSLCSGVDASRLVEYWWMVGDDMISRNYASRTNSQGWVDVTNYDPNQNTLEGTFEMDLIDYEKRIARFRKGVFKVKIIR
jgi:hypothetical protein